MTPVDWERARPLYEDMTSVLLSNIYPTAQRIDGSGGDGGRDVQLRNGAHVDLFELKSFTGRLGSEHGRRRQVERSLSKAKQHSPRSWSLVVPIDPTPGELDWFDGLRDECDFPLSWLGLTWLNQQMADRVRVGRYFLEDGANEAIRLLKETSEERSAIGRGLPEALQRFHRLAENLDDVDPYYRVDLSVRDGTQTLEILPRYVGAELERPIFLTGQINLPDTEIGEEVAQALLNALRYGDEAFIPAEFTAELSTDDPFGISEIISGSPVTILPGDIEEINFSARVNLVRADGAPLTSMPIKFTGRRKGTAGARLYGADPTGAIRVELLFDLVRRTANLSLSCQQYADMLPGSLLTYLRFTEAVTQPNRISLSMFGEQIVEARQIPFENPPANADLIEAVEKLDYIQRAAAMPFVVPEQFTAADIHEMNRAYTFFRGETVEIATSELSFGIHMADGDQMAFWDRCLEENGLMSFAAVNRGHTFTISDVEVTAGDGLLLAEPVRIANPSDMIAQKPWSTANAVKVRLSLEGEETAKLRRVVDEEPSVVIEQSEGTS